MLRTFVAFLTAAMVLTSTASAAGPGDHFTFTPSLDPSYARISYGVGAGYVLLITPVGPADVATLDLGICPRVGIRIDETHLAGGAVKLHVHGGAQGTACSVWIGRPYDRKKSVDLVITVR